MIIKDIYAYLSQDEALKTLLRAGAEDTKIYPNAAKIMSAPPFIVYRSLNPGGAEGEILYGETLSLIITAQEFEDVCAVTKRLSVLLDGKTYLPSRDFYIYHCKKTGGADGVDELSRSVRALNFSFKFRNKEE